MTLIKFQHRVSKGSRFNQIYIPKQMLGTFETGDLVEVRLVEKKEKIFYSDNLKRFYKLSKFKENLIKQVFSLVKKFPGISQLFIVGSFLTERVEYTDIDIVLITDKKDIEEKIYKLILEKVQMNFHVIVIPERKFDELTKVCPLVRSMFYYFVSDKEFSLPKKTEINKKHIDFLLMMPEDLLRVDISKGKVYFDCLRRLVTIKRFLKKQDLNPLLINEDVKKNLKIKFHFLKDDENLENKSLIFVKDEIKKELSQIRRILKKEGE